MEGSTNGPEDQVNTGTVSTTPWTPLSAYEPKNIDWLWKPRFIANRINTIAGLGDVGKDVFCCGVAAVATGGMKTWPDGTPGPAEPMKVGVICPEDEGEDTIRPRMEAAGANIDLIRVWPNTRRVLPRELKTLGLLNGALRQG